MNNTQGTMQPLPPSQAHGLSEHLKSAYTFFKRGTEWKTSYQRNNKSHGQKNLRCFPMCNRIDGHQKGFCGRKVQVTFAYNTKPHNGIPPHVLDQYVVDNLMSFGGFHPVDDEHWESFHRKFTVGEFIPLDVYRAHLRSNTSQLMPLIEGCREDAKRREDGTVEVSFDINRNLRGWHYGFQGSKKTRNLYHMCSVYVCEIVHKPPEEGSGVLGYRVLGCVVSPRFQIFCRRRISAPPAFRIVDRTCERVYGPDDNVNAEQLSMVQKHNRSILNAPQRAMGVRTSPKSRSRQKTANGKSNTAVHPGSRMQPVKLVSSNNAQTKRVAKKKNARKHKSFGFFNRNGLNINTVDNQHVSGNAPGRLLVSPRVVAIKQEDPTAAAKDASDKGPLRPGARESTMKRSSSYCGMLSPRSCLTETTEHQKKLHVQHNSNPESSTSCYKVDASGLPMPPAIDSSNALLQGPATSDHRFELLLKLLKESGIPSPSGNYHTAQNNSNYQPHQHVVAFLTHCKEMTDIGCQWSVPHHVQWARQNAVGGSDPHTDYAMFLVQHPGFISAVENYVKQDQLDIASPGNAVSVQVFLLTTLKSHVHQFHQTRAPAVDGTFQFYDLHATVDPIFTNFPSESKTSHAGLMSEGFPSADDHNATFVNPTDAYDPALSSNKGLARKAPPKLDVSVNMQTDEIASTLASPTFQDLHIYSVRRLSNSSLGAHSLSQVSVRHQRTSSNSSIIDFLNPRDGLAEEWKDDFDFDFDQWVYPFGRLSIDKPPGTPKNSDKNCENKQ